MSSNIILLVQFGFLLTFAVLIDTYVRAHAMRMPVRVVGMGWWMDVGGWVVLNDR